MRKAWLFVVAGLLLTGCNKQSFATGGLPDLVSESDAAEIEAARASRVAEKEEGVSDKADAIKEVDMHTDKILELYNKGVDKSQNWCFSPYSLLDCMSLVAPDVGGKTADEFGMLGLDAYDSYAEYDDNLPKGLLISNRAYINEAKSSSIDTSYMRKGCDFAVRKFDDETLKLINHNVANDTNNKIDSILGSLSPEAVAVMVNALYFNNSWDWDAEDVYWIPDEDFRVGFSGELEPCDVKELSDKVDMARLAYPDTDFSMYLICANEQAGTLTDLDTFMENDFSLDMLCQDTDSPFDEAYFKMPSFEYSCMPEVKQALIDSGVTEFFSSDADFGRLGDLTVDSLVQKTYIKVNNKGTEASAATAMVTFDSLPIVEEKVNVKNVVADEGFVFVIKDEKADVVLFMGRVVDPVGENGD